MRCAFGIGAAILLWHATLLSRERMPAENADGRGHMVNLPPFTQGTVRRAIDLTSPAPGLPRRVVSRL